MLTQTGLAPTLIKRSKSEIPFFYPGKQRPKVPSRSLPLAKAARKTATPDHSPFAPQAELALSRARSWSDTANAAELRGDPSGVRCMDCDARTRAATELARLPSLIAELAALTEAIRPLAQKVHATAESPSEKPKRKYTRRRTEQKVEPIPLIERKWLTFKQAAAIYPKSEQALRHLAHQAGQYQRHPKAGLSSNGFEKCIARQPGSRNVYLIVEELDRWMANGQGDAQ